MARIVDYQFGESDFYRDSGVAKIKNGGTSGTSNDAVMYTGQGIESDGVDDKIILDYTYNADIGGTLIIDVVFRGGASSDIDTFGSHDGNDRRFYIGRLAGSANIYMRVGSSDDFFTQDSIDYVPFIYALTYDPSTTTAKGYSNGSLISTATDITSNTGLSAEPMCIFAGASGNSGYSRSSCYNYIYTEEILTDEQIAAYSNNPEKFLYVDTNGNVASDVIDATKVKVWCPLDEGTGSTIKNIASGNNIELVNFASDDTQWTNADEQDHFRQKARIRSDETLADPHTIRFD